MFRSYRIGRLFGFPVDINVTFLMMLLVAFVLWGGVAGLFAVLVAFSSVLLHELGHAVMARHLRVPVAGIELHFFGGAAKMAQPRKADDEIAIAAAGPAVSFALGGLSFVLYSLTGAGIFGLAAWINTIIGVFNLVPALPMDGGRIFRAVLSKRRGFRRATETAVMVARGFSILLGLYGLVTLQLYLVALAVVLWLMGTAEQAMARRGGGYGSYSRAVPVEVMPPGTAGGFHRPVQTGGFVIRRRNGRLVVELL